LSPLVARGPLLYQTLQILWATAITRFHSNNEFSYNSVVKKSLK
jgi:hypothetical protein